MMIDLEKALLAICARNRDGSYSTQANRRAILSLAARDLVGLGFFNLSPLGLKPKHVEALVKRWQGQELGVGTLKNRLAHLRWWAEKVNKASVIARDNAHYGIENRVYVTNRSKALRVADEQLAKIKDERLRCSVELQRAFGLRREECLKFQPGYAVQEDHIRLKPSWTKGGKARIVPIRNEGQRAVLEKAKKLAGGGSMIPPELSYKDQLNRYTAAVAAAGLSKLHGLRHEYAQRRYAELAGWPAPALGGPTSKDLSPNQKSKDQEARLTISRELGHEREQITAVYLGR